MNILIKLASIVALVIAPHIALKDTNNKEYYNSFSDNL